MREYRSVILLILIMTGVTLVVGGAAILIGFTDDGDHTCLIAKGELNRVDMLYCFSKGIQNLFERMDALKQDGGVQ